MNYFSKLSSISVVCFILDCPNDSILKQSLTRQTVAKTVIILIDAWQEQFFYRRKAMQFLRQLTSDGQAVAFIGNVQIPTVTMPRIKVSSCVGLIYFRYYVILSKLVIINFQAVTAGIIPSFADVVLNFASTSISSDNIIDQFIDKGYK